jgi:hypothetical protein
MSFTESRHVEALRAKRGARADAAGANGVPGHDSALHSAAARCLKPGSGAFLERGLEPGIVPVSAIEPKGKSSCEGR